MPIRIRISMMMPILILIRIRIGIKTMPILMRVLPQVLHMLENRTKKITFSHSISSLQSFIFLISVKSVIIFSMFDSILKFSEKSKVYQLFHLFELIYRSGFGKMMRSRPDQDPQRWVKA
jgi:hypothetical protein